MHGSKILWVSCPQFNEVNVYYTIYRMERIKVRVKVKVRKMVGVKVRVRKKYKLRAMKIVWDYLGE